MSRMQLDIHKPYRSKKDKKSIKIFISCEGVTEEEYFKMIKIFFQQIRTRIEFVSVREEILDIPDENRTQEQKDILNNSSPLQLVRNIDYFKSNPKNIKKYDFKNHPDDEFWIITDVDKHTQSSHLQGWVEMMKECRSKGYNYSVSNPFFELWLLLHHDDTNLDANDNENDIQWAVTDKCPYRTTNHFKRRLSNLGVPLKNDKHITTAHYDKDKVNKAIERAKKLDTPPCKDYPRTLGTTVYKLLEKITDIEKQYNDN